MKVVKIGKFKLNFGNPAVWIIIGYCLKGTAVTVGMIYTALFVL